MSSENERQQIAENNWGVPSDKLPSLETCLSSVGSLRSLLSDYRQVLDYYSAHANYDRLIPPGLYFNIADWMFGDLEYRYDGDNEDVDPDGSLHKKLLKLYVIDRLFKGEQEHLFGVLEKLGLLDSDACTYYSNKSAGSPDFDKHKDLCEGAFLRIRPSGSTSHSMARRIDVYEAFKYIVDEALEKVKKEKGIK